jgi:hypothetical protein
VIKENFEDYAKEVKEFKTSNNERYLDLWRCVCICHEVNNVKVKGADGNLEESL